MGEILSSSVFGIVFLVISIVLLYKERFTAALIVKYLATYMYTSLAYTTYIVISNQYAQFIFIAIALSMLGDIAMSLKLVVSKHENIAHYVGVLLYIIENIFLTIGLFNEKNINASFGFFSIIIAALIIYLLVHKKKDLDILQLISNIVLLLTSYFVAITSITALISVTNLSSILLCAGSILVAIGSSFFVIDQYTINDYFFLKVCNNSCRYLGQLLITISMVFIFYV